MLVACISAPPPAVMLVACALLAVVVVTPLLNLGALTAVAYRPGHDVVSIRRVAKAAIGVGLVTALFGAVFFPLAFIGVAEIAAALATLRLNARRTGG